VIYIWAAESWFKDQIFDLLLLIFFVRFLFFGAAGLLYDLSHHEISGQRPQSATPQFLEQSALYGEGVLWLVEKAQNWIFWADSHVVHGVGALDQRAAQRVVTLLEHVVLDRLEKRH